MNWLVLGVIVVIVLAIGYYLYTRKTSEGFFTEFAQEEPTRSYVPYTGTIAYGEWGNKPWAVEYSRGCGGKCARENLRDVQVGTDIKPICGTCASTLPPLL